ncbi:MAG: hypothetical protein AAFN09_13455 [Pseudomonadota bacterium]
MIQSAGNGLGLVALAIWPFVVFLLFRKLPFRDALIWSIVGGYLFLPAAFFISINPPVLPSLDKEFIPAFTATLVTMIILARQNSKNPRRAAVADTGPELTNLPGWLPRSGLGRALMGMVFFGILATAITNGDPLTYGARSLPAQSLYDGFSALLELGVIFLPLLLGRKFLSDDVGHKRLLVILFISALIYTLPAMYEVRMSPQINRMVYGFFPHSWVQHIRGGGFRPLVFLDHGLLLGIHFTCALIAGVILVRLEQGGRRLLYGFCAVWLFLALILSKTLGAFLIALTIIPIALLMPVRLQLMAAAGIALIMLSYPILRGSDMVPTEALTEMAAGIDERRAASLQYRFDNEDLLLGKANERPAFGWGWWTRARVYNEFGVDISVPDGAWIVTIGERGWVGYIGYFGFLTLPMVLLFLRRKRYEVGLVTAGLCMATAANLLDLLPNASLSPVLMLSAGALLGRLELVRETAQAPEASSSDADAPVALQPDGPVLGPDMELTRYSRFPVRKRTSDGRQRPESG